MNSDTARTVLITGASCVYWMTQETNTTAMRLYDRVAEKPGFLIYRQVFA